MRDLVVAAILLVLLFGIFYAQLRVMTTLYERCLKITPVVALVLLMMPEFRLIGLLLFAVSGILLATGRCVL